MRNPTLLQCFHWYYPEGGKLWPELAERADGFNDIGINMVWLPPAYKGASGGYSVGYDSYDLFDQKGSIPTKYGDKAQLLAAIDALKRNDIAVLLDVVVNHKMGADEKEAIRVQRVNADDRTQIDEEIIECEGWTRYTFPARAGQYSQFIWDFKCFSGIDHIENPDEDGIFKIVNDYTGEGWNDQVDDELGNAPIQNVSVVSNVSSSYVTSYTNPAVPAGPTTNVFVPLPYRGLASCVPCLRYEAELEPPPIK